MKISAAGFLLFASVRAVSVSNYVEIDYQPHWEVSRPARGAALLQTADSSPDATPALRATSTSNNAYESTASTMLGPLGEAVLGPFGGLVDIARDSIGSWRKSVHAASKFEDAVSLNTDDPLRTMEARNLGPTAADRALPLVLIAVCVVAFCAGSRFVSRIAEKDHARQLKSHELEEEMQMEVALDHDVYGASIYSIIHDGWDIVSNTDHDNLWMSSNIYHLCLVMSFLITNYLLQMSLLYLTYSYVVTPGINKVQKYYNDFRTNCYTQGGMFNQTAWDSYDGQEDVCGIVFSHFWFTFLILVLWCGTMLKEWRHNERMYRNIRDIPAPDDYEDDIIEVIRAGEHESGQDTQRVVRLGPILRTFIYAVVVFPKFVISLILLISGIQWLSSTVGLTFLVLNSVSLIFIVHIDELLYDALMAASTHRGIENFKLYPMKSKDRNVDTMYGYFRSTAFLIIMFFIPYLYLTIGQEVPRLGIFPEYDRAQIISVCEHGLTNTLNFS